LKVGSLETNGDESHLLIEGKGGQKYSMLLKPATALIIKKYLLKAFPKGSDPKAPMFFNLSRNITLRKGKISTKGISHLIKKFFGKKFGVHGMRSLCCRTTVANANGDVFAGQNRLRHKNVQTTLDYLSTERQEQYLPYSPDFS